MWSGYLTFLYDRVTSKKATPKPRLLSDYAIGSHLDDEDLLGRKNVVSQIISVIKDYDTEGAFVVGLTGQWGTGKTTVLNFALKQIQKMPNVTTMVFDPWYFSTGTAQNLDTLLRRFFDELENAIGTHAFRPNLSKLINRYYDAITPILKSAPLNLAALLPEQQPSLEVARADLERALAELAIKIVVIVDDLDRMNGVEIAYIFKIIRLCGSFKNLIYLVAFDSEYVQHQARARVSQ